MIFRGNSFVNAIYPSSKSRHCDCSHFPDEEIAAYGLSNLPRVRKRAGKKLVRNVNPGGGPAIQSSKWDPTQNQRFSKVAACEIYLSSF